MEEKVITGQAVRQVLRDYWRQYRNDPWRSLVAFSFPAIGTIFIFFIPPLIVARIIDIFIKQGQVSISAVSFYLILFGILWFLGEVMWRIGMHALIRVEAEGISKLAKVAFDRLVERDYDFYSNNFVGSLTKKTMAFSRSFEIFTDTLNFNIFTDIIPIIFALIVLWGYSPWIPLILVVSILIAIGVGIPIIRRRSKLVALRHEAASKVSGRLSDSITNILAIKSFASELEERRSYSYFVGDYVSKFEKAADYQNLRFDMAISPLYVIVNIVGLVSAIYFTGTLGLEVGAIIVIFSYFSQITRVFWQTNRVYRNIESSISEAAEFNQMFVDRPAVLDVEGAKELSVDKEASIQFQNVGFKYENEESEEKLFLDGLDLDIKGKQKIGLVGPSGGGKTTITKLLLRFIDIKSGQILINGQDISEITQTSLRKMIAYVPQEPLLFHRSLSENIAYGSKETKKEDIIKAAKLAHAHEFISKLPDGYETLVGERGIKLSGGQRQRVAIARALLKKAPILVLDEATSSLDSESEKYIQDGLRELMKDKTALVIAHRLSTIKHLDRIIVLSEGKIVQDGTHEQLIKKRGLYAKLWGHQTGEFLED